MKRWILYRHTSPSGKVYIGITSKSVNKRWNGGRGYKTCIYFYNAILKYGWDNIKHELMKLRNSPLLVGVLYLDVVREK